MVVRARGAAAGLFPCTNLACIQGSIMAIHPLSCTVDLPLGFSRTSKPTNLCCTLSSAEPQAARDGSLSCSWAPTPGPAIGLPHHCGQTLPSGHWHSQTVSSRCAQEVKGTLATNTFSCKHRGRSIMFSSIEMIFAHLWLLISI